MARKREFEASATIEASPEAIWTILLDGGAYPEWDPTCERIEGRIAEGQTIKAYSKLSPGRAFPVKVKSLEPGRRMIWQGGMPLGLFKGVRTFTLEPRGASTEVTIHEVFSGPMLALIGGSLPDLSEPFRQFVAGLKARAEGGAG